MSRVLVTGGAGFIGLHMAKRLAEEGHHVTIWDDLSRGSRDGPLEKLANGRKAQIVELDMTDARRVRECRGAFDLVFHMAAVNGTQFFYENPARVMRVNLLALVNLLDWLTVHGCGRVVFTSSSETYAGTVRFFDAPVPTAEDVPLTIDDTRNPRSSYAASKLAGEVLVHSYGLEHGLSYSVIRYHNIYGPRMGTDHVIPEFCLRTLKREDPFVVRGADNTRAFCYVEDAVEATVLTAEHTDAAGETIHVGNSAEEISISALAHLLFDLAGFHPRIDVEQAPPGSVSRRCPDTSRLTAITGFKAKISLQEGLPPTYEWYGNAFAGSENRGSNRTT